MSSSSFSLTTILARAPPVHHKLCVFAYNPFKNGRFSAATATANTTFAVPDFAARFFQAVNYSSFILFLKH